MNPEHPHPGDDEGPSEAVNGPHDPTSPDPVDDLASAHLDGELVDPDEVARAEGDPEVAARRETFREVSDQVGAEPPAPPATERDGHIAAALDAAGSPRGEDPDPGTGDDPGAGDPVITSPRDEIAARRRHRRAKPRWLPPPAVAAAVLVVLAVVGLTLVLVGNTGDNAQTAAEGDTSSGERATEQDDLGAGSTNDQASGAGGSAGNDATSGTESPNQSVAPDAAAKGTITVADLGTFADQAELTTALGGVDPVTLDPPEGGATATLARPSVDRCEDALVAIPETDLEPRTGVAAAELAGERVVIYANRARNRPGGPVVDQLSVIEPTQCDILFAVQP